MTALAAGTARPTRNDSGICFDEPTCTTGTTIYEGSLVMATTATGLALPGADTAACTFLGIACETVVSAAAGQKIKVKYNYEELMTTASTLVGTTNTSVCISDSDVVEVIGTTTNDVKVGPVVRAISTVVSCRACSCPESRRSIVSVIFSNIASKSARVFSLSWPAAT